MVEANVHTALQPDSENSNLLCNAVTADGYRRFQTGLSAVRDEILHILALQVIILLVYFTADDGDWVEYLLIPTLGNVCGIIGAIMGGYDGKAISSSSDLPYWFHYYFIIGILMGGDMIVRYCAGGSVVMCITSYAALIGSASSVHILCHPIKTEDVLKNISIFGGPAWVAIILMQGYQMYVTFVGSTRSWLSILLQIIVRRVLMCFIVHFVCLSAYHTDERSKKLFYNLHTLEYMLIWGIAERDGTIRESNILEQTVVGSVLLKLPFFGGEYMLGGQRTLTRVVDKLVFTEQIIAFSSPTFVTDRYVSTGHTAFIRFVLMNDGDPAEHNKTLMHREECKKWALEVLRKGKNFEGELSFLDHPNTPAVVPTTTDTTTTTTNPMTEP